MNTHGDPSRIAVIGAGPAGLTAAWLLCREGVEPVVFEKSANLGGIARTEIHDGYRFDMGGHRFFTKSPWVRQFWEDLLGEDFLVRPRLSRIYYNQRFFDYPPRLGNTLRGLGPWESARVISSYLRWHLFPHRPVESFEHWVTNHFGQRLFQIFFKSYTEKVWGISCKELGADWAAQRIQGMNLKTVLYNALGHNRHGTASLMDRFHYPRLGPGMLWERAGREIAEAGGVFYTESDVVSIRHDHGNPTALIFRQNGAERRVEVDAVISNMPLPELMEKLDPKPPLEVRRAAGRLEYRSLIIVCLIIDAPGLFPDNWIYVHEPGIQAGRIQNFGNWSEAMVADPSHTALGIEYFCDEGDELWRMDEQALLRLGEQELTTMGLLDGHRVIDGKVYRAPKAYPVYDGAYGESLATVREYVDALPGVWTIGRSGLHRYNNQDHSMLTARYAVRNLLFGERHDIWGVNTEEEYLEGT